MHRHAGTPGREHFALVRSAEQLHRGQIAYVAGLGRMFCLGHSDQNIRFCLLPEAVINAGGTGDGGEQADEAFRVSAMGTSA